MNPSFGPLENEVVAPDKRTMTLVLATLEMDILEALAKEQDMSKAGVLRQALRLYQMINARLHEGLQMAFVDKDGQIMRTHILGVGPMPVFYTEKKP